MPRRAELKRISHHSNDVWLINYILWLPCGCSYERFIITYRSDKEPTVEQAMILIDEDKDKR